MIEFIWVRQKDIEDQYIDFEVLDGKVV